MADEVVRPGDDRWTATGGEVKDGSAPAPSVNTRAVGAAPGQVVNVPSAAPQERQAAAQQPLSVEERARLEELRDMPSRTPEDEEMFMLAEREHVAA